MPTFLIHEKIVCEVTFVKRVTADTAEDALDADWDGDSDLLGVVIGDARAGAESEEVLPDAPQYIPVGLYTEASRT
jgi:hypothetical protein